MVRRILDPRGAQYIGAAVRLANLAKAERERLGLPFVRKNRNLGGFPLVGTSSNITGEVATVLPGALLEIYTIQANDAASTTEATSYIINGYDPVADTVTQLTSFLGPLSSEYTVTMQPGYASTVQVKFAPVADCGAAGISFRYSPQANSVALENVGTFNPTVGAEFFVTATGVVTAFSTAEYFTPDGVALEVVEIPLVVSVGLDAVPHLDGVVWRDSQVVENATGLESPFFWSISSGENYPDQVWQPIIDGGTQWGSSDSGVTYINPDAVIANQAKDPYMAASYTGLSHDYHGQGARVIEVLTKFKTGTEEDPTEISDGFKVGVRYRSDNPEFAPRAPIRGYIDSTGVDESVAQSWSYATGTFVATTRALIDFRATATGVAPRVVADFDGYSDVIVGSTGILLYWLTGTVGFSVDMTSGVDHTPVAKAGLTDQLAGTYVFASAVIRDDDGVPVLPFIYGAQPLATIPDTYPDNATALMEFQCKGTTTGPSSFQTKPFVDPDWFQGLVNDGAPIVCPVETFYKFSAVSSVEYVRADPVCEAGYAYTLLSEADKITALTMPGFQGVCITGTNEEFFVFSGFTLKQGSLPGAAALAIYDQSGGVEAAGFEYRDREKAPFDVIVWITDNSPLVDVFVKHPNPNNFGVPTVSATPPCLSDAGRAAIGAPPKSFEDDCSIDLGEWYCEGGSITASNTCSTDTLERNPFPDGLEYSCPGGWTTEDPAAGTEFIIQERYPLKATTEGGVYEQIGSSGWSSPASGPVTADPVTGFVTGPPPPCTEQMVTPLVCAGKDSEIVTCGGEWELTIAGDIPCDGSSRAAAGSTITATVSISGRPDIDPDDYPTISWAVVHSGTLGYTVTTSGGASTLTIDAIGLDVCGSIIFKATIDPGNCNNSLPLEARIYALGPGGLFWEINPDFGLGSMGGSACRKSCAGTLGATTTCTSYLCAPSSVFRAGEASEYDLDSYSGVTRTVAEYTIAPCAYVTNEWEYRPLNQGCPSGCMSLDCNLDPGVHLCYSECLRNMWCGYDTSIPDPHCLCKEVGGGLSAPAGTCPQEVCGDAVIHRRSLYFASCV